MRILQPILEERGQVMDILDEMAGSSSHAAELQQIRDGLASLPAPLRRDVHAAAHAGLRLLRDEALPTKQVLITWKTEQDAVNRPAIWFASVHRPRPAGAGGQALLFGWLPDGQWL